MKILSDAAQDIAIAESRAKYDTEVKTILANKEFLSKILKEVVTEFKDLDLETIKDSIENNPKISATAVHPGHTNSKIKGMSNESNVINEGTITFDIIFDAHVPKNDEFTKMIINIEPQNNFNPGYFVPKRAIYYGCRMISSQYGREFEKSDYNKIKKVYSIWICTNPSAEQAASITKFSIQKDNIYNNIDIDKDMYDLMDIVIINLSKDHKAKSTYVIEMLNTLLTNNLKPGEKIKKLEQEYGIPMTEKNGKENRKYV